MAKKKDCKVAIGLSRKWNAKDAGEEVIFDMLKGLDNEKPDIVLLFSTIQYSKKEHGGFQVMLNTVQEKLPKGVPVVGGTVAGFIIPNGCFTRGLTAMAIKSESIDFSVAISENLRKDPENAAKKCALKIKKDLKKSEYTNKFLLNLPAGIVTPKIPGIPENTRVIQSKTFSNILLKGLNASLKAFQKGPSREKTIIKKLAKELPEYKIIGGSFIDDNKGYSNYQFHNGKLYKNTLVTIGMSTKNQISVNSTLGLIETDKKFKITKKSMHNLIIEEINNKPALSELRRITRWPKKLLSDSKTVLRTTFYNPLGYKIDGKQYISVMAFIFGERIMVSPEIDSNDVCIMRTSGKQLIDTVSKNLSKTKNKKKDFGLITACIARLETLGSNVYEIHKILKENFKDTPFLQIYTVGEDVYTKELGAKRIAESYNTGIFHKK